MEDLMEERQKIITELERIIDGLKIYVNFRNPNLTLDYEISDIKRIESQVVDAMKASIFNREERIRAMKGESK